MTQFIYIPFGGLKEWMEAETPNLIALVERIKDTYWSDWDSICKSLELNTHLPKKETSEKDEEAKLEEAKKKEEEKKKKEEEKKKAAVSFHFALINI